MRYEVFHEEGGEGKLLLLQARPEAGPAAGSILRRLARVSTVAEYRALGLSSEDVRAALKLSAADESEVRDVPRPGANGAEDFSWAEDVLRRYGLSVDVIRRLRDVKNANDYARAIGGAA